jgi:TonB family protein
VVGLSGTSFGNGGSFSVRAGNTTMGKADGEAKRPDEVEPLAGVPTFRLDRRPRQLGDCSIEYPEELKRDEVTGDVILEVQVLETGRVGNVRVKESLHPVLDQKAVEAMKRCRFSPPLSAGEPVRAVISRYVYTWELDY